MINFENFQYLAFITFAGSQCMLCFQIPLGELMNSPCVHAAGGLKIGLALTHSLRTYFVPFVSSVIRRSVEMRQSRPNFYGML